MSDNFKLVRINSDYCDYLRKYDYRVPFNNKDKKTRPFVGILFKINDFDYFAPLSSPKVKHRNMRSSLDYIKLDNGNLEIVNFNNMLPVTKNVYKIILINYNEHNYSVLLQKQLDWLNENKNEVRNKATKLYKYYNNNHLNGNIMGRCCDFKLLEEKCVEYNKVLSS
ncbi:MAG: type III toxin-antitoxin system ToxN/AbiQ family toxin [Bacilli bacterium]|nr:type III toxin-antitoxin system ToxN/AbiQ family toxin [Bacilli bacterium]